jgi:hypothetical protein
MVDCKIYPLNPSEQKQLDEFLKEQLEYNQVNHRWRHHSSLKRKTELSDRYRIIEN